MRLLPTKLRNAAPRVLLAAVLPVLATVTARAARAQANAPVNPADVAADAALADRVEALAALTFPAKVPTGADQPLVFAQQAALFRASATLDPLTVRYARKLAEALADGGADAKVQADAMVAILRLQPSDEFTWNRLLDLHVDQLQTAPEQIAYLQAMEGNPNLPPTVLAHAGSRHAQILSGQDRPQAARKLLKSVLLNNPLDLDALRLQYHLLPKDTTPVDREEVLLNILKANPLQPRYARLAALVAADAGLTQDAISFFSLGVNTSFAQRRPDYQGALEWAAELYVAGQNNDAFRFAQNLLQQNPTNADLWYLDLLIARSSGIPPAGQARELQRALVVMTNRVAELMNGAADAARASDPTLPKATTRATTRPFDFGDAFPLPDVSSMVDLLKRDAAAQPPILPPRMRQEFIDAVSDLARVEIYFAHKPDVAAPLIDALTQLLPANDPLLTQLHGLSSLVAGDTKDALATLAGVAKDDPIAAMGLILAQLKDNPANTQQADMAARELIQEHPDGLIGAFLIEALSNPRVKLMPKPGMQQLQQLLQSFPHDLFNLGVQPDRLYSIHVEPVDAGRAWGQPLLARITLFNFSPADLTIGDEGAIHPGLMFRLAALTTNPPTPFPAYDTLSGPVVLHPRIPLTQVVRVDQAGLIGVLDKTVRVAFQIDGQAATNADVGLGGYAVRFTKPFDRTAVNPKAVGDARDQLNAAAVGGSTPAQRVNAVGVVQAYVGDVRNLRNLSPEVVQDLANLKDAIHRARGDASPAVSTWAAQAEFALADDAARATIVSDLVLSPDWRHRLLGLILVHVVGDVRSQTKVVGGLTADPDPIVSAYAKATSGLLSLAALHPATAPAAGNGAAGAPSDGTPAPHMPVPLP